MNSFRKIIVAIGMLSAFCWCKSVFASISAEHVGNGTVVITWEEIPPSENDTDEIYSEITEGYAGGAQLQAVYTSPYGEYAGVVNRSVAPGTYTYRLKTCWRYVGYGSGTSYIDCTGEETATVNVPPYGPELDLGSINSGPVIQITAPQAGTELLLGSTTFKATATDADGVDSVRFYFDGNYIGERYGNQSIYQLTFNTQNSQVGFYTLSVVAEDVLGNVSTQSIAVQLVDPDSDPLLPVNNQPLDFTKYEIYYVDYDGDGLKDLYFRGKDVFVLLHGDIAVPIMLPGPPGMIYTNNQNGGYDQAIQLDLEKGQYQNAKQAVEGEDYILGDLSADGNPDILVRGETEFDPSAVISGTTGDELPQVILSVDSAGRITSAKIGKLSDVTLGANLSNRSVAVNLGYGSLTANNVTYNFNAADLTVVNPQQQTELAQSVSPAYANPSLSAAGQKVLDQTQGLTGAFKVSEVGAATYTVPIKVAPGSAGVTPQIALSYNSQGGKGALGLGWSMDVGGAITRCRQTLLIDKAARPITFTGEDRFCLNGQRLLLESGTGAYGAAGSKYRTEMATFQLVEAVGQKDGAPDYFKVTAKDGSVSFYGHYQVHNSEWKGRNDSGVAQNSKISTWALSHFKDNMGNTIVYNYEQTKDHFRLANIEYAFSQPTPVGSLPGTIAPVGDRGAKIEFSYASDTPHRGKMYMAGYQFHDNSRLESIKSFSKASGAEEILREYHFGYDEGSSDYEGDDNSRLTSIRECVGEVCLPSLWFSWGYTGSPFEFVDSKTLKPQDSNGGIVSHVFLDINGDSRQDIFYIEQKSNDTLYYGYAFQQADGDFSIRYSQALSKGNLTTAQYLRKVRMLPLDINADGRMGIAFFNPDTRLWESFRPLPPGWGLFRDASYSFPFPGDPGMRFADLNADGVADAYRVFNGTIERAYLERNSSGDESTLAYSFVSGPTIQNVPAIDPNTLTAGDVNGDGVIDFIGVARAWSNETIYTDMEPEEPNYTECKLTDTLLVGTLPSPQSTSLNWITMDQRQSESGTTIFSDTTDKCSEIVKDHSLPAYKNITVGDLNGDGVSDLIWGAKVIGSYETYFSQGDPVDSQNFDSIRYVLGKGNGNFEPVVELANSAGWMLGLLDADSDGDSDLYFHRMTVGSSVNDPVLLAYWEANGFSSNYETKIHNLDNTKNSALYFDATGDGSFDRIITGADVISVVVSRPTHLRNQIIAFNSGHGAKTEVFYEPLSHSENYYRIEGEYYTVTEEVERRYGPGENATAMVEVTRSVHDTGDFYKSFNAPFADVAELLSVKTGGQSDAEPLKLYQNAPVLEFLAPMQVVTRVESTAPSYDASQSSVVATKAGVAYLYGEAKIQAGGRGFLGFKTLTTIDLQSKVQTTTQYRQDWPFIGSPLKTTRKTADGQLLSEALNIAKAVVPGTSSSNSGTTATAKSKESTALAQGSKEFGPVQVYTAHSEETTYDYREGQTQTGAALKITEVVSEAPDRFGNAGTIVTYHKDGDEALFSKQTVENEYFSSTNLPLWQGRLESSRATTERTGQSTQVRTAFFEYYTTGAHKGMVKTERVEVNDASNDSLYTTHYYDTFGNPTFKKLVSDAGTRVSDLAVYDSRGRFPSAVYSVFSSAAGASDTPPGNSGYFAPDGGVIKKVSEVVLRDKHGIALQTQSYIGNGRSVTARQAVTPFGNVYFSSGPSGDAERVRANMGAAGCPSGVGAIYSITSTADSGGSSGSCFDVLGRAVSSFTTAMDGSRIYSDKRYDVLSRVIASSEPYKAGTSQLWTEVEYDTIGRPVRTLHPFDTVTRTASRTSMGQLGQSTGNRAVSSVEYLGLQTRYTNAEGHTKTETSNILGEITAVTESGAGENRSAGYDYDASGNLTEVTHPGNTKTFITYNVLGQKTSMDDPDKGVWSYKYNGFGEQVCQQDAVGNVITSQHDLRGRKIARQDYHDSTTCNSPNSSNLESSAQWIYDSAPNGLGQLAEERDLESKFSRTYSYDDLGRASETVTQIPGVNDQLESHFQKATYDQYGRAHQSFDAARSSNVFNSNGVQNVYNQYGHLKRVVNAANTSEEYYRVDTINNRGQVNKHTLGANVTVDTTYHASMGLVTGIVSKYTSGSSTVPVQQLALKWDHLGNLLYRTDGNLSNAQERYEYDGFNQLRKTWFVTGSSETLQETVYNSLGNITSKTGLGSYGYGAGSAGIHAVTSANGHAYTYDSNGNMTLDKVGSQEKRKLNYTAFNKVSTIEVPGELEVDFYYGTGRSRYKRVDTELGSPNKTTTTLYIGGVEKIYHHDGKIEWKRSIAGVGQVTIEVNSAGQEQNRVTHYFLKDHLGSTNHVVDASGLPVANGNGAVPRMAFDPWGNRRQLASKDALTSVNDFFKSMAPITTRGFTGHEMVDGTGIIHMNGRIYDPLLGRFLQADPFVQKPMSIGSLNRYSYVMNNPLNAVDPSGYFFKKLYKGLMKATGTWAVQKFLARNAPGLADMIQVGLNFIPVFGQLASAHFALDRSFFATGSLTEGFKAGVISYASSMAFSAIGGADFGSGFGGHLARSVAHGMVGGVISVLQGGKFGNGFVSAGLTKFANVNGMFDKLGLGSANYDGARVVTAAIIGGTISEQTGGKFANGAVTAAIGQAYNGNKQNARDQEAKAAAQKGGEKGRPLTTNEIDAAKKIYGDTIDYSKVRIISGKYFFLQGKNTMMAPNGNIYDPRGGECADYTTCQVFSSGGARLDSHGTFIHEMGHIAQHQAGVNVFWRGLGQQLLYRVSFGLYNPYSVTQGSPPPITNIEAFAEYNRRNYCTVTGACNGW